MKNTQNKIENVESQIQVTECNIAPRLTPLQEAFVLSYLDTNNATESYRRVYGVSNMKPTTINRSAKKLLDNDKIRARLLELKLPVITQALEKYSRTLEGLLDELDLARNRALAATPPQTSAAVACTMGKAKLLGLITDKVAVTADNSIASLIREIEVKTVEGD